MSNNQESTPSIGSQCGGLICDGEKCHLVATLLNQAETNLHDPEPGADPRSHMPEKTFMNFLKRTQDVIPMCCQRALAQEVYNQIEAEARAYYGGKK